MMIRKKFLLGIPTDTLLSKENQFKLNGPSKIFNLIWCSPSVDGNKISSIVETDEETYEKIIEAALY